MYGIKLYILAMQLASYLIVSFGSLTRSGQAIKGCVILKTAQ